MRCAIVGRGAFFCCNNERFEDGHVAKQKSDLSRAFSEDGALKTHIGGQALLEGVMMRGKRSWAVAVREPDGGIYTEEHELASGKEKNAWLHWPLVRGCCAFVESLVLGYKALSIAVEHAFVEEVDDANAGEGDAASGKGVGRGAGTECCEGAVSPSVETKAPAASGAGGESAHADADGVLEVDCGADAANAAAQEASKEPKATQPALSNADMVFSMAIGLVLGVVLFIVAPAFITNLIVGEYDSNTLLWNIVDGLLRIAVFVFYIWLIGRMDDINRMYGYHGAEHKTIHCYEHGLPLTPENAARFPRLHVRCGTAFLIMVMIIAIFVYTVTPINSLIDAWGVPAGAPKLALVIAVRILLMPVIAGVSYEITVKWAGSHPENPLVKVVLWPGLQMQRLTTREPGRGELECAIAAMRVVVEAEDASVEASDSFQSLETEDAEGLSVESPDSVDPSKAKEPEVASVEATDRLDSSKSSVEALDSSRRVQVEVPR